MALGIGTVYAATGTSNALSSAAGTVIIDGKTFLTPTNTNARINIAAGVIYQIVSAKYDKANSTINGTATVLNAIYYNISDPTISTEPATKNYVDTRALVPAQQFYSPYATVVNTYTWTDFQTIPSAGFTQAMFDSLPAGLYGFYTGYLPASRLGILPTNTKGYLTCNAYQNGGGGVYNKRYRWESISNVTYYAWINERTWNSWTNVISNIGAPVSANDAATKNYVDNNTVTKNYSDLYGSALTVFNVGTHGILLNTNAITLTTTATALTLTNSGTIFNNPKSNIITLNNTTQVFITAAATVSFMYSAVMTVGTTTGTMELVVYNVTAANPSYTIAPTPAINTTTEYLLRGTFTSVANHTYEFRVQITATGNIQFGMGYLSYGY